MSVSPPTPNIGLVLPVPSSGQPWRTTDYVTLLTTIDNAFGSDRGRLVSLESSRDPANIGSRGIPAGSTSARDAFWGVPSDDAGALVLQQKGARWFNTDNDIEQTYFGKYDAATNKQGWLARGWQPSLNSGWNLIRPGSVAGSGVTIGADGAVVLNAAGTASINNAFWGLFTEYMIELNLNTLSGAGASGILLKLRAAGADLVTASYNWAMLFGNSGSPSAANLFNANSWQLAASLGVTDMVSTIRLDSPAETKRTMFRAHSSVASGSVAMVNDTSGINTSPLTYDGFTLTAPTGTLTGTAKVFGLHRGGA